MSTFSDAISKKVIIKNIYLDASFIYALIASATDTTEDRFLQTRRFYNHLYNTRAEMWTSYLSVQELMHLEFRDALFKEIRQFEKNNNIKENSLTYSSFKKNYRSEFNACYKKNKSIFHRLFKIIIGLKIQLKIPKDYSVSGFSKGRLITRYAKCLLDTYILEVADAFHIATARCNGTKIIATNDLDFKQVKNITVFSFR
jgi:predicted nucleic acid-binding protein